MKEAGTINFIDIDSSDDEYIFVRFDENRIALGVSLNTDGDVEVIMKKADDKRLLELLQIALG